MALPISIPHTQVIVYGSELNGETPKSDFTDIEIPIVKMNNPKIYIKILTCRFFTNHSPLRFSVFKRL
ncbi:MAG: hypothetical protein II220_11795 [Spirochaetales bacterium]|nr:hypothetical protein [Spirochaetales bacterium]